MRRGERVRVLYISRHKNFQYKKHIKHKTGLSEGKRSVVFAKTNGRFSIGKFCFVLYALLCG